MDEEREYRLPAKVLTNRDPVILNKLSIREFFQWAFFFMLVYFIFNDLPELNFTIRLVVAACIVTFGGLFIHAPLNGLAGIEWIYVYIRFVVEKSRHRTAAPVTLHLGRRPKFSVSMALPNLVQTQEQADRATHQSIK